jgi:sugar phosphate isomerase/epimerase
LAKFEAGISIEVFMFNEKIVCAYLYIISKYGYPPAAENSNQYLKEMKELGFQSVELEGIREQHLMEMYDRRHETKNTADKLDLDITYYCVVLPGLASADANERKHNLKLFEKGCETAAVLQAKGVLDNAPLPPYEFPIDIPIVRHYDEDVLLAARFPKNLVWKDYWQELVTTYSEACDIAADKNLTYLMHPCLGVLSATTDAFLYFYDAVGRDNLRFNLDTANQFVLKDNLSLCLRRLAGLIDYIHISDNRGTRVEHIVPDQGTIHWDSFFETLREINFDGCLGLDIGGEESKVENLESAYITAAEWLEKRLNV